MTLRADGHRVTLTFDNGPDPQVTPQVLDTLARQRVAATFFVVGEALAAPGGRALALRARDAGHRIGNHTWSHGTAFGALADPGEAIEEIERTQRLLGDLGEPERLFRPSGSGAGLLDRNLLSRTALDHLCAGGYTCALWNCVPEDWITPDDWVARALADVARQPWTVVVVHDLPTGAMRHLDAFIEGARAAGASFVQTLPPECTPIVAGRLQWDPAPLVRD